MHVEEVKILKTSDYEKFKRLEGNRKVARERVKKIRKSIEKVGYIPNPIIVNEKYEVIDGQGRLQALKELEKPVFYIVVPNIGMAECISMNIDMTNWTLMDYIESYAEKGKESYVYLLKLIREYANCFRVKVITNVITGKGDSPNNAIKTGAWECTEEDYNRARQVLHFLMQFREPIERIKGNKEYYYMALTFCYEDPEVDNKRLLEKVMQQQSTLQSVVNIQMALQEIERVYNHRIRSNVYILTNYRKCMEGKYGWYNAKYGRLYSKGEEG